jgi:hypothetical protein
LLVACALSYVRRAPEREGEKDRGGEGGGVG